jgi:hypothetical protein
VWSTAESHGGRGEVYVVDAQRSQLGDRGAVQQPEQADHGFVRVQIGGVAGPSTKELALAGGFENVTVEWHVGVGVQASGGVGEDVAVLTGEPKEDLQGVQVTRSVARVGDVGEEGFDVADTDEGPVGNGWPVGGQVAGEVADGGQVDFEGAVRPGFGSGAACPIA